MTRKTIIAHLEQAKEVLMSAQDSADDKQQEPVALVG